MKSCFFIVRAGLAAAGVLAATAVRAVAPNETWEPKADAAAVVTCGSARFTVLTDRLIRMEYAPDGAFDDRATLTFVNRKLPVPSFTAKKSADGKVVTIDTGRIRLTYKGGPFASETLSAAGPWGRWSFGQEAKGNLYGTKRTLDGVYDRASLMKGTQSDWGRGEMEQGLLSREGWTLVDDSANHAFVPSGDHWGVWPVVRGQSEGYRDCYLFAYGHAYRDCLGDYVKVAGRIPLPPKWAFGYWWSRYWLYSDAEVRELATQMRSMGVPLDVFILDMEWHETWNIGFAGKDEFGQYVGWTGYTWNRRLFPDPKATLGWFHANGIRSGANLHPASGVQPMEACYGAFCRDYGWTGTNAVPYRMAEAKWADSYFKTVLGPIEDQGMDFWWLDWQQWATSRLVPGLSNTFWLNHVFDRHAAERDGGHDRPMIYHRWGGLGSHRYQVGFSGDAAVSWRTLELLPWFTATASNVGYGYWGHDIGGHCFSDPEGSEALGTDGDLYLRWLQSGVFTPIFKTHSTKMASIERRIWKYPGQVHDLREAIRLRYRLAPYVYTAARQAYETGVSLCRPMYYDWPECDEAYPQDLHQYMFGDDILAGTVVTPMDPVTKLSDCRFWFPEGRWFDPETGAVIAGGRTVELKRTAAENPWFVRAGAVLPLYPDGVTSLAQADDSKLVLLVAPGMSAGEGRLYEDAGTSARYDRDFATTEFAQRLSGRELVLTIGARRGAYEGMPATRGWEVRLPNRLPPERVTVNGKPARWRYQAADLTLVVETGALDCAKPARVSVAWSEEACADAARLDGLRGFLRRCAAAGEVFKVVIGKVHWAANVPNSFLDFAQFAQLLDAEPMRSHELLADFDRALKAFPADLAKIEAKLPADALAFMRAQLGLLAGGTAANPFVGSAGVGHVTPAAAYPFGLVQAGPDTSATGVYKGDWAHTSGYQHGERFVHRFSQLHLSGTGCSSLGKIGLLPFSKEPEAGADYRAEMRPETETARPGAYAVTLTDGIAVEIAAAPHAAVYRVAFPAGSEAKLLIDLDWAAAAKTENTNSVFGSRTRSSALEVHGPNLVTGSLETADWVEYALHFAMRFSSACRVTCLEPQKGLRGGKWIADFGKATDRPLEIRLGISLQSTEAAQRNLSAEAEDSFDAVRAKSAQAWAELLGCVKVDPATDPAVKTNLMSALYRLAIQPNDIGDADKSAYSTFSLWDTFRAAHPLYTLLWPEKANAFVNSILDHGEALGTLPIWPLMGRDTHCMIGHHAVPVVADVILKGLANPNGALGKGVDRYRAFGLVCDSLRRPHQAKSAATWGLLKEDWEVLDRYGYYPFDALSGEFDGKKVLGESVSRTLECAYDDACAARLARALGKHDEAAFFERRAANWTNVFDRSVGFVRGRDCAGKWREPFDPFLCGAGPWLANDLTEGNAWQYTWHVMHDPEGLVAAFGGRGAFGAKLASLFEQKETVEGESFTHDVSGLVGQYAHGNEPSHHTAYFFRWSDRPWMTDEVVRKVFDTQYFARADGLCGNDDCGQMAAWYVFSALGFYPFDPCGGEYVLGAPQLPGAWLILDGGKVLRVVAKNFSRENKYVRSVTFNGRPVLNWKITHNELLSGGDLVFEMASTPK